MNWGTRNTARLACITFVAAIFFGYAQPALAQSSVTVPGQVSIELCPEGYRYQTGIEVRIGTGVFTVCYAPPTDEEILVLQQNREFEERIQVAQSQALEKSRAFNEVNPGMQLCVQWGPVTHINGVTTSSGGVCANPLEAANAPVTEPAPPVFDETVLPSPTSPPSTNQPFYVFVPGQVAASDCPSGYQGANGIVVNATTHQVQTQCWAERAWQAWVLGGDVWQQFEISGGAYDVQSELNRRAAILALKARALASASAAADQTPGVRRCSEWSGYSENGVECAYSFVAPQLTEAAPQSESVATKPEKVQVETLTFTPQHLKLVNAVKNLVKATNRKTLALPASRQIPVTYKSATPKICTVVNSQIKRKTIGTCKISIRIGDGAGPTTTEVRKIVFTK